MNVKGVKPINILLAEANDQDLKKICASLKARCRVAVAHSVNSIKDMRAVLSEFSPDLAIVNYLLKDGKGLEILNEMRSYIEFPVILTSDYEDDKIAVEAIEKGAVDYVAKSESAIAALPRICGRAMIKWGLVKEKEKAVNALRLSVKRFRSVTETATDAIVTVDEHGIITYWNNGAKNIFGFTSGEALGKPVTIIMPERFREKHIKGIDRYNKTGKVKVLGQTLELVGLKKNEVEFPVELTISTWSIGKRRYFTSIIRDITERKKLETKLIAEMKKVEASNKELQKTYDDLKISQAMALQQEKLAGIGQLAAGVAHEINNPMGFISSNVDTLGRYFKKLEEFISLTESSLTSEIDSQSRENIIEKRNQLKLDFVLSDTENLIRETMEGAGRVTKIVQDLKSFARPSEEELKISNINECVKSTLNIVWNEIKYKATVDKELGNVPAAKCNPQQLNQVFMNILINAADSIDEKGVITIKSWLEDSFVFVSISDTGCGISGKNLTKIFDPFFTTKEIGKGTGLGMSISYDIIKKHDGKLEVESKVGKGTTFTISLPVETICDPDIGV